MKYMQMTFRVKAVDFGVFDGSTLRRVYGVTAVERGHLAD